jgi:DNA polymerase-3 subunit alpha
MDCFGTRAQLMAALDKAIERAQKTQRDAESGQHGLFGVFEEAVPQNGHHLPSVPEWDEHTRLANEKEVLGFFITGHPLEKYKAKLDEFGALDTAAIGAMQNSTGKDEIFSAGIITNLRVLKSKRGDYYAQASLEDMAGAVDVLVFPEAYRRLQEKLRLEVPVLVRAAVRVEENANPKLIFSEITSLEEAQVKLPRSIRIRIALESANASSIEALQRLFHERRGEAKVLLDVERDGDFMVVMEPGGYNVQPDRAFRSRVEELFGRGALRIVD